MNYKFGDKVRVRKDLKANEKYNGFTFTEEMGKFKGKEMVIHCVWSSFYELNDGEDWCFSDDMLEDANKKDSIKIIFNNNTTIAKSNGKQGIAVCNIEKDEFDVVEGVRIAVSRLLGKEVKELKKEKELKDYTTEELLYELLNRVK